MVTEHLVDWAFSCGRSFLSVRGYVIAVEGDVLRDMTLTKVNYRLLKKRWGDKMINKTERLFTDEQIEKMASAWSTELIKYVAAEANGGVYWE